MNQIKLGTYCDIKKLIKSGYEPVGDLKEVLENYKDFSFFQYGTFHIWIDTTRKIIDTTEVLMFKPYPCLLFIEGCSSDCLE